MHQPNKYLDIVLLAIFALFISMTFYQHFSIGLVVYLNNVFAAICLLIGIFLKIKNPQKGKYVVFILLIVSTFGIINFIGGIARIQQNIDANLPIQPPGIDPITLLILIVYCIINRSFFWECYSLIFFGSKQDQDKKGEVKKNFYYAKFNNYNAEELKDTFKMYNDFPEEAQIALRQIHEERKLNIIEFN